MTPFCHVQFIPSKILMKKLFAPNSPIKSFTKSIYISIIAKENFLLSPELECLNIKFIMAQFFTMVEENFEFWLSLKPKINSFLSNYSNIFFTMIRENSEFLTVLLWIKFFLVNSKLIHAFFIRNDKSVSSTRSFLIFTPFLVPKIS